MTECTSGVVVNADERMLGDAVRIVSFDKNGAGTEVMAASGVAGGAPA